MGGRQRICIPADYQKYDLPDPTRPTFVTIGVDIKDIPKVSDKDFSITLNAYFNVKWRDPRLLVSKDYTKEGPPPKVISTIESELTFIMSDFTPFYVYSYFFKGNVVRPVPSNRILKIHQISAQSPVGHESPI